MESLFFTVTSTTGSTTDPLCLHPTGTGWLSDRLCAYPQEIRLELEGSAEIHEIQIGATAQLPLSMEIRLASNDTFAPTQFDQFGIIEGDSRSVSSFGVTSGVIQLLVYAPAPTPKNPYNQVMLRNVEIWGRLGRRKSVSSTAPPAPVPADSEGHQIERALLDCGIPLDLVPHTTGFNVDKTTSIVMEELRQAQRRYLDDGRVGDVQKMADDLEKLQIYGGRLRELEVEIKALFDCVMHWSKQSCAKQSSIPSLMLGFR